VELNHAEWIIAILVLLVDLAIAGMIEAIGNVVLFTNHAEDVQRESREQQKLPEAIQAPNRHIFAVDKQPLTSKDNPLISMESLPLLAAQFYYWSPVTILSSSVYSCFQTLPALFHLICWNEALSDDGSFLLSTFFLAMATYLELHHIVYLIPLMALPMFRGQRLFVLASFAFWFACLQGLSYQLVGNNLLLVVKATYRMGWKTIRPSLSVQWYLAVQLFSRFRGYFGALLLGAPYILVAPVAIRLARYPMVMVRLFEWLSCINFLSLSDNHAFLGGHLFDGLDNISTGRDTVGCQHGVDILFAMSKVLGKDGKGYPCGNLQHWSSNQPRSIGPLALGGPEYRKRQLYVLPVSCL